MAKGFQKGNKLAKANAGRMGPRKKMFAEVSDQLISLSPTYNEKLVAMSDGQKLSAPEREFMDRFEKMFEFARPKLARQEVDLTTKGKALEFNKMSNEELLRIARGGQGAGH